MENIDYSKLISTTIALVKKEGDFITNFIKEGKLVYDPNNGEPSLEELIETDKVSSYLVHQIIDYNQENYINNLLNTPHQISNNIVYINKAGTLENILNSNIRKGYDELIIVGRINQADLFRLYEFSANSNLITLNLYNTIIEYYHYSDPFADISEDESLYETNSYESNSIYIFINHSGFKNFILPKFIRKIEIEESNNNISTIHISAENIYYSSIDGVLYNKRQTKIIRYPDGKRESTFIIPSTVHTIGENAFYDCYYLTEITIPKTVTKIENSAFWGCDNLCQIKIPESVDTIAEDAFAFCSKLTLFEIPYSVTQIGDNCFNNCKNLSSINTDKRNNNYTSENGILFSKDRSSLIKYPENKYEALYTIPETVIKIHERAFSYCKQLKKIKSYNYIKTIDEAAFIGCTNLNSITISNSIIEIADYTFSDCENLKKIKLPKSLTIIGKESFLNCTQLTRLIIPISVKKIRHRAFSNCKGLTRVTIPKGISEISYGVFMQCSNLKKIKFQNTESLKYISSQAFSGCISLLKINIPSSLTNIGSQAFLDCKKITKITIPDSVTEIGYGAFNGCSELKEVKISNSITTIEEEVFANCSNLLKITIPDTVTRIGKKAFMNCKSLTIITIPDSVTEIDDSAFEGCSELKEVKISNSITKIWSKIFANCTSLDTLLIPDSVTQISYRAFYGCTNLKTIIIGANILLIQNEVFEDCTNLQDIYILNPKPPKILSKAFLNCSSKMNINVPNDNSVTSYKENKSWINEFPGEVIKKSIPTELINRPSKDPKSIQKLFFLKNIKKKIMGLSIYLF